MYFLIYTETGVFPARLGGAKRYLLDGLKSDCPFESSYPSLLRSPLKLIGGVHVREQAPTGRFGFFICPV